MRWNSGFWFLGLAALAGTVEANSCPDALNYHFRPLTGEAPQHLCDYAGQVVLVVNTASKCGFTPQYEGLEALYAEYRERGFVVLGFPSNDFGGQEPGSEEEIQSFCRLTYGVQFPMFEKVHARKDRADPFYRTLAAATGDYPNWNFHKYLINREGQVVGSYSSWTRPNDRKLVRKIESLL